MTLICLKVFLKIIVTLSLEVYLKRSYCPPKCTIYASIDEEDNLYCMYANLDHSFARTKLSIFNFQ